MTVFVMRSSARVGGGPSPVALGGATGTRGAPPTPPSSLSKARKLPGLCRRVSAPESTSRSLARVIPTYSKRRRSASRRSEEHTSELQSRPHLVCRLLLEKKKKNVTNVRS